MWGLRCGGVYGIMMWFRECFILVIYFILLFFIAVGGDLVVVVGVGGPEAVPKRAWSRCSVDGVMHAVEVMAMVE